MTSSWHNKPIKWPQVDLLDEQGRRVTNNHDSFVGGQEEPAGTYAFYNVPAGSYQFLFRVEHHHNLESKTLVTVTPGATVTVPHAHLLYGVVSVPSIATSPPFRM